MEYQVEFDDEKVYIKDSKGNLIISTDDILDISPTLFSNLSETQKEEIYRFFMSKYSS